MRISDALAKHEIQLQADGRSEHTVGQRRRHVRLFDRWITAEGLPGDIEHVDHEVIARFLASRLARTRPDGGVKRNSSMNALRSSLRAFFQYAEGAGYVDRDPTRLVRRALCSPPPPRTLTAEQGEHLLKVMSIHESSVAARDAMLFSLLLRTGIRLSSALSLETRDLEIDRRILRLRSTKGDAPEAVIISERVAEDLREFVAAFPKGPLFPIGRRQAHRRLAIWLSRAGIDTPASPHALRHTFATQLYQRTGDIRLVQQALRHRSIASTVIYARADESRLRQALG